MSIPGVRRIAIGLALLSSFFAAGSAQQTTSGQRIRPVAFFDVPDLPVRLDEPKLRAIGNDFLLDCAVANRSAEYLLGLRLILLIVDRSGKLRSRLTWTEVTEIPGYSIKNFTFNPVTKSELLDSDRLYLGLDEVTGRETIWHAVEAEKALRTYARGQPAVMPEVKTVANKYDKSPNILVPLMIKH